REPPATAPAASTSLTPQSSHDPRSTNPKTSAPRRPATRASEINHQDRTRFYLQRWPSARAMGVLRGKIRVATSRSRTERPVADVVTDLNPVLQGWSAYFRNENSARKFNAVDGYVHERLAIFASRKHGLAGRNWTTRYTYGWITRLGVFRLTGNVRGARAHAQR
ncbi:MAG TPA: group II intron maturase-specific domain-containing protein, partial [Actinocrinis sp.]|nr:group II intron maturase-specific domain-containing protein [Actinocrinis sp.]